MWLNVIKNVQTILPSHNTIFLQSPSCINTSIWEPWCNLERFDSVDLICQNKIALKFSWREPIEQPAATKTQTRKIWPSVLFVYGFSDWWSWKQERDEGDNQIIEIVDMFQRFGPVSLTIVNVKISKLADRKWWNDIKWSICYLLS